MAESDTKTAREKKEALCAETLNNYIKTCDQVFTINKSEFVYVGSRINNAINKHKTEFLFLIAWDPSSALCSASSCQAIDGDKPLFFYGDHLTRYDNSLLVNSFDLTINESLDPH